MDPITAAIALMTAEGVAHQQQSSRYYKALRKGRKEINRLGDESRGAVLGHMKSYSPEERNRRFGRQRAEAEAVYSQQDRPRRRALSESRTRRLSTSSGRRYAKRAASASDARVARIGKSMAEMDAYKRMLEGETYAFGDTLTDVSLNNVRIPLIEEWTRGKAKSDASPTAIEGIIGMASDLMKILALGDAAAQGRSAARAEV